ncbi:hypothetical protein F5X99DRAFT_235202 [Biscogniauxia marginata]|nr:hypothetical protein F5X99DRAFT_235202 [Biscogniauxia marginata]
MSVLAPDNHTAPGSGSGSAAVSPACECWPATLRIVSLCQGCSQASSSPSSSSSLLGREGGILAGTLAAARDLVQHWGAVNGCARAEAHMDAQMLRCMADAIALVLRDHEAAIDAAAPGNPDPQSRRRASASASAVKWNAPRTYVGKLELDAAEAAIVAQEALKHSLIRLAAMLQDLEEESALLARAGAENPLRDRDVKSLITRLFRMLGNVNRLATV